MVPVPLHGGRSCPACRSGPHECPDRHLGRAIADTGPDGLRHRLPGLRPAVPTRETAPAHGADVPSAGGAVRRVRSAAQAGGRRTACGAGRPVEQPLPPVGRAVSVHSAAGAPTVPRGPVPGLSAGTVRGLGRTAVKRPAAGRP